MQQNDLVTVFGASGFVGRHAVRALAKDGWRIRAVCRRPNLASFLLPAGQVGQIQLLKGNVNEDADVLRAVDGAAAVVNLTGVLTGHGRQSFENIHVEATRRIARASKEAGVETLVHVSAVGADADASSRYAKSKAEGEAAVWVKFPAATVLRPSVVFGPEDRFFNKFASLARFNPALPLIGGGHTKFQPVYAADVAAAIVRALTNEEARGKTYELGGPAVYTFEEILRFILRETGRKRLLVPVPFSIAKLMAMGLTMAHAVPAAIAGFFGAVPSDSLLTVDQVRLLATDNVVKEGALGFADLGLQPQAMEPIVSAYLWRYHPKGQFRTTAQA